MNTFDNMHNPDWGRIRDWGLNLKRDEIENGLHYTSGSASEAEAEAFHQQLEEMKDRVIAREGLNRNEIALVLQDENGYSHISYNSWCKTPPCRRCGAVEMAGNRIKPWGKNEYYCINCYPFPGKG